MATDKVSIDEMAEAINEGLQKYGKLAAEDMKAAVKKTATNVKKEISTNAPKDTGAYAKSWKTRKTAEDSHSLQVVMYSKEHYRLAHLLEKGHANRGGGRTKAYPHIAPAEKNGEEMLKKLIKSALKG